MITEYQCKCNRCGAAWCLSDEDIANAERQKKAYKLNMLNSAVQAVGKSRNTAVSVLSSETAQNLIDKVKDPSRCPQCGSINIDVNIALL